MELRTKLPSNNNNNFYFKINLFIFSPLATEKFFKKLNCPIKKLYLHEEGYHKRKEQKMAIFFYFVAHDDIGTELVFEEIESFINEIKK